MSPFRSVLVAVLAVLSAAPGLSGRPAAPSDPREFLRTSGDFSADDFGMIDRGQPVARVLDTDRREVAVVGAVRISAPVDRVLADYRDVSLLGRSSVVEQVGTFSSRPRLEDLQPLAMEDYDLETIRECVPGDCGVRLSATDMERFRREVRWESPDWRESAGRTWRKILVDFSSAYLAQGAAALSEYRNKEEPLRVAQELEILFQQSAFFEAAAPAFMQHVRTFPKGGLQGTDTILYWTKDNFGIRPVFSITHLLLHRAPPDPAPFSPLAMIAAKQVYATHYFDAGLGLTAVYAHPSGGLLVVAQHRARTRSLTSLLRSFVRSTVRSRSRDAMEKILRSMKKRLEQDPIGQV
jgi:hypothetical protein